MKTYRNLSDLLHQSKKLVANVKFKEIKLDSRKIEKGDIFLAIVGSQKDGRKYINHAISRGASAIIAESNSLTKEDEFIKFLNQIPIVFVKNIRKKIVFFSKKLYGSLNKKMKLIGVTGTNGKTTVSHIVAQLAKLIGQKSAVMGTIGNGLIGEKIYPSELTTLSCFEICSTLKMFLEKSVKIVAMEVSSHGLDQGRTCSLSFSSAIFTNITRDHLDYHNNIEHYELSKKKLFYEHDCKNRVFFIDDPVGSKWIKDFPNSCAVSINHKNKLNLLNRPILYATKIEYLYNQTIIRFNSDWGNGEIRTSFLGEFNVANFMLAIASLLMIGYPIHLLIKNSKRVSPVIGRMQLVSHYNPRVIIDYAHNSDSLKQCLISIRKHFGGKIWCVFGCGGSRDKGKRAIMGRIAEKYSDFVIITDDNPRFEDPKKIFKEILRGCTHLESIRYFPERKYAIRYSISRAKPNDTVLIAGKGHEEKQIVGDRKILCSDYQIVVSYLKNYSLCFKQI